MAHVLRDRISHATNRDQPYVHHIFIRCQMLFTYQFQKIDSISFSPFSLFSDSLYSFSSTNMSCSICLDPFNASNRKPIPCPFDACTKTACRSCYETFLCGDGVSVAKCIFCNTSFTHSQVQHLGFTKSFLTGNFAKHQQDILFAQEQAMLPAAQAAVAHDRLVADINAQIKDVIAQIKQLQELKDDLHRAKIRLVSQGSDNIETVQQFVHRCADSDCNGFVSSAWKCATCDKHTCAHCRELKAARDDEAHVCNPDTLASVALLKKDTKPCPNCKVLVHKTEGCDQMFCTQCKRLWSWNTGQFETRGHNPHYLQWMRANGAVPRELGDVLCGREVDHDFIRQLHASFANRLKSVHDHNDMLNLAAHRIPWLQKCDTISKLLSGIPHLRFHDAPRFQVDHVAVNFNSRKAFVNNSMTLLRFKQTIRRNHVTSLKNDNIFQILQAVIQAATDISFRLLQHIPSSSLGSFDSFILEFKNLIAYANNELHSIHNDFLSTPMQRTFLHPSSFALLNFTSNPSL